MADEFFDNFSRQVAGPALAPAAVSEEAAEAAPAAARPAPAEGLLQN